MRISDWSSDVCSSDLLGRIDLADVHAMLPPERQEAGVHFRRHGSGPAARRNFRGPESLVAGLVIQMFDNGEAVPHHCLTVPKDRHLAGRRGEFVTLTAFVPILTIKGNDSLR